MREDREPEREVLLHGGIANDGQVVRVGDTVRRPQRSWSPATHALLLHLEAVGFAGAPRFLGVDAQGREVLSYVAGAAVVPPYPEWGLTDEALVSVAELLRGFHEAVAGFDLQAHAWPLTPPDAFVEGVVSHNDPNLDNVVFRDGRAVALIDFDLAGPGSRAWDVACAARLWAPLRADVDIADSRRGRGLERFRLFVDSYGMDEAQRVQVARGVRENYRWFCELISSSAAGGHEAFANYWRSVPRERLERTARWLDDGEAAMRTALGV
jgi:hypothetical protein